MSQDRTNRQQFPSFPLEKSMWSIHHGLVRMPLSKGQTLEERIRLLEEDLAVRDLLARYTYCYDGDDVDGLMTVFHDDCVLVNPRGTYIGKEAIRRNYEYLISRRKFVFHYAPNVAVRLFDDCQQAWMTAYLYAIGVSHGGQLYGTGGTYADHLVKVDGEWKTTERRITSNFRHVLSPEPPGSDAPPPPLPSRPETAGDFIGPGAMM